jgi:hypothetical protein
MKKDKNVSHEDALKIISESTDLELLISYCHVTDPLWKTAAKRLRNVLPGVLEKIDDIEYLWKLFDTPCQISCGSLTAILDRMDTLHAQSSDIEAFTNLHQKFLTDRSCGVYYERLEGRDLADVRKHIVRSIREHGRENDLVLIMNLWLPRRWSEFKEFVAGVIANEKNLVVLDEYWSKAWKKYGPYGHRGGMHDETAVMIWNRMKERREEMEKNNEQIPHTAQQAEEAFLYS